MRKLLSVILFAAIFFTGCSKEETLDSIATNVVIGASVVESQSRVAFDQDFKFLWTVNDTIGVTTTESSSSFSAMTMAEDGAGKSSTTFSAYMAGTPKGYAVYPYSNKHSMDGTQLTYNFPTSYDYGDKVDEDFFVGGQGNSWNAPMWAEIVNKSVQFKHLGGVLCIKIADLPAGENQTLKVNTNGQRITGDFTTDLSNSPVLITELITDNEAGDEVTFTYDNAEKSTRVFYVPVPTGLYEKITVTFMADNKEISIDFVNKQVDARDLWGLQIGNSSLEGGEAVKVSDIAAANDALVDGKKDITIESATTGKISIPEQTSTDTEVAIEIGNIESGSKITIEDANGSTQSVSVATLYLTVPEENVEDLVINLPKTTVYVNGVIASLMATTADNTLIVSKDARITTAKIQKGHVRIQAGGEIGTLVNETGKTLYVILEEGADAPTPLDENTKVVSVAEFELIQGCAKGGEVTLTADIELSEILTISAPVVLNGGGYKISSTAGRAINVDTEGDVTIKNLTIECTGERGINIINQAANVTLEDVNVTAVSYAVNVWAPGKAVNVNIENSELTALNVVNVNAADGATVTLEGTTLNCVDESAEENYAALVLCKDAINSSIVADDDCTFNIGDDSFKAKDESPNGNITIDGSTDEVAVMVAAIEYGDQYYGFSSLEDAAENAKDGDNILLLRDVTLKNDITTPATIKIEEGVNITLDLNGKTIEGTRIHQKPTLVNNATLRIMNGTISSTGKNGGAAIVNNGTVTIVNVTLNGAPIDNTDLYDGKNSWWPSYAINNNGEMTVDDVTVKSYHGAIATGGDGVTVIEDATVDVGQSTETDQTSWALYVHENGQLTVNGGTFSNTKNENGEVYGGGYICTSSTKETIINGGTFDKTEGDNNGTGFYYNCQNLVINGGTFDADPSKYANNAVVNNGNGTWTVMDFNAKVAKGGTITLDGDITVNKTIAIPTGVNVTLDLNEKTIVGTMHKDNGPVIKNEGTLTVKDGTISSTGNNGGAAIVNNGTLTVNDATLNGAPNADGSWPSYTFNNTGDATVTDSKFTSYHGSVSSYGAGAKVTLKNCEIDMAGIPGFTSHGIYTYNNGAVVVNGGKYANKAKDQNGSGASVINGAVTVNAGTFTGRIENYYGTPILNGGTFNANPSAYVAEGKDVIDNGDGTWTVK